jgi:hypothetical protein
MASTKGGKKGATLLNDTVEAQGVDLEDDDDDDEVATVTSEMLNQRKVAKGRAGSTRPGQPRNIYCHLCGQPTDLKTFRTSHLKVCRRMWREDENSCVKALIAMGRCGHEAKGRPFPPEPMLPLIDGDVCPTSVQPSTDHHAATTTAI